MTEHKCSIAGCELPGTELRDVSLQLPDYRYFCKAHAVEHDQKEKRRFAFSMLRLTAAVMKRDFDCQMLALEKAIADLEQL